MKKIIASVILLIFAAASFYYSLFWGWASGAGSPPNAVQLKSASNVAFGVSLVLVAAAVLLWLPVFRKKKSAGDSAEQ